MKKEIYIYGHKNPDTDSICSAISMAYLKNKMAEVARKDETAFWGRVDKDSVYVPMAAGEVNSETAYVLDRFNMDAPDVATDIRRQVKDIEIKKVPYVGEETTLKDAWDKMHEENAYTIPVMDEEGMMKGIITLGDITRAYMDVYNSTCIAEAGTSCGNIAKAVGGKIIVGNGDDTVDCGRVYIVAANIQLADKYVNGGDIAILCDNKENQKFLIEKGIRCMIICSDAEVSEEILKDAEEKGIVIITTTNDTYKVARMINQSIPVRHFMRADEEVVGFSLDDYVDDIKEVMAQKRHRDFPVTDANGTFLGMVTKSSLIDMGSKKVILVDHNEIDQAVFGLFDAEVVEIVDHHKLGTVETMQPISVINKPVGCSSTIVYQLFKESEIEIPDNIAGLLCSAILSDTMMFKSPTCTEIDMVAAKEIAKNASIDLEDLWASMLRASLDLESKTEKDIFYQDYKQFKADGFTFGAGQVLAADEDDVDTVKDRMLPYLDVALKDEGIDMVCLMITNVSDDSTELIFAGTNAQSVLESAFGKESVDSGIYLEGVVSRKKQLIPPIMAVLQ